MCLFYISFRFFFQAEDGIRDYKVTGVQTCALPIFFLEAREGMRGAGRVVRAAGLASHGDRLAEERACLGRAAGAMEEGEIGRASCRERVGIPGVVCVLQRNRDRLYMGTPFITQQMI